MEKSTYANHTIKRVLAILILLAVTVAAGSVRADIYRLEGDDDTIAFTDTPNNKRFQLVMKEQQPRKSKSGAARQLNSRQDLEAEAPQPAISSGDSGRTLPISGRITSPSGLRNDPIDGKLRHHNGVDIAAPAGTPVKAVAPGTVVFSGWKGGYGNMVIVDHNDGMTTVYAHHASNDVTAGTAVDSNTIIAYSGSSGRSTGPHLHFEAWRNGVNITPEFMPNSTATPHIATLAAAPINRYLQTDGTIIFTNLR